MKKFLSPTFSSLVALFLFSIVCPRLAAQTIIFQETFDGYTEKSGGNSADWNGAGTRYPSQDNGCDNEGWTFSEQVYQAYQCIRVSGSGSNKGEAETPALGASGNLTLSFRAGAYNSSKEHTTMELSVSGGGTLSETKFKLKKKEFTEYTVEITGATEQTKIKFQADSECKNSVSNRYFLDDVVVTSGGSISKTDPSLAFEQSECHAVINGAGVEIKTPVLTFNAAISLDDITFTSSNQDVVENGHIANGHITADGFGTTVITASFEGNEQFKSASASYTLTLSKPSTTKTIFQKATSVKSGSQYMIVAYYNGTYYAAQAGDFKAIKLTCSVENDKFTIDNLDNVFTIAGKPGAYTIQQPNEKYIGWKSGTQLDFNLTSASNNKAKWNFVEEDGLFHIICKDNPRYIELQRDEAQYFRAYDTYNYGAAVPALFEMVEINALGEIEVKAQEGFGTFYTDQAIIIPDGLQATTVQGVDSAGKLRLQWEYQAGDAVPANTGLLVYAANTGSFPYFPALSEPQQLETENYLHGTLTDQLITEPGNCKYYQLTYGEINSERTFGFFFGEEDGAAFINKANKAYLALPLDVYAGAKGFNLSNGGLIEGIEETATSRPAQLTIYTLAGTRIQTDAPEKLPRGIYIVNGQKTIIR